MKRYSLLLLGFSLAALANTEVNEAWKDFSVNRDATVNVYGVSAKVDKR